MQDESTLGAYNRFLGHLEKAIEEQRCQENYKTIPKKDRLKIPQRLEDKNDVKGLETLFLKYGDEPFELFK